MTNGEMGTHAAGRWELINALGQHGIIQTGGIWRDGPGKADAEIAEVVRRIERALRREYREGQRQTRRDVWRVLRGKKPRDLRAAAPVLYELLKTMRRSLVMVSGLKKLTTRRLMRVFYGP